MAVTAVANQIRAGQIEIGLAVGVESMSAHPDKGAPPLSDDIMAHGVARDCVWVRASVAALQSTHPCTFVSANGMDERKCSGGFRDLSGRHGQGFGNVRPLFRIPNESRSVQKAPSNVPRGPRKQENLTKRSFLSRASPGILPRVPDRAFWSPRTTVYETALQPNLWVRSAQPSPSGAAARPQAGTLVRLLTVPRRCC